MEQPGFVIGNIAKGNDLWDRKREISAILKSLQANSVLLKAPRRFGKTTIMNYIYEHPLPEHICFFLDLEGMRTPEDFISGIMAEILSEHKLRGAINATANHLKQMFAKIDEIGIADYRLKLKRDIDEDWQVKGDELISLLKNFDRRFLFIIDEFPILLQNIARHRGPQVANDFLHWFRALRQRPELSQTRWLAGGSIGIEHILEKIGSNPATINDFQAHTIGPFSSVDGDAYIKALLKNEGRLARVTTKTIAKIHDLIGAYVPFFIQILIYESLDEMRLRGRKSLTDEILEYAYQKRVLGPASRTYFEHYFTRLKEYFDTDSETLAKRLILETARSKTVKKVDLLRLFKQLAQGNFSEEDFSYLMTRIENDYYITFDPSDKTYSFTTNILRDWWLRYYDLVEE